MSIDKSMSKYPEFLNPNENPPAPDNKSITLYFLIFFTILLSTPLNISCSYLCK